MAAYCDNIASNTCTPTVLGCSSRASDITSATTERSGDVRNSNNFQSVIRMSVSCYNITTQLTFDTDSKYIYVQNYK